VLKKILRFNFHMFCNIWQFIWNWWWTYQHHHFSQHWNAS